MNSVITKILLNEAPILVEATPTLIGQVDLTKANENFNPQGFKPEGYFSLALKSTAVLTGDLELQIVAKVADIVEVEEELYNPPIATVFIADYPVGSTNILIPLNTPVTEEFFIYLKSASGDITVTSAVCLVQ